MVEFYPCSESSPIVEIIDENFVVVSHCGLSIIYSTCDDMFNATKLCKAISSRKFHKWNETKEAHKFKQRFPHFFKVYMTGDLDGSIDNRLAGTYIHSSMLNVIVSWANPMVGYCLVNGMAEEVMLDKSGFLYLVQPERYLGTNVFKYGITWNTKQRFSKYGGDKCKVFHIVKVNDMYSAELTLHGRIDERVDWGEMKIVPQTREYVEGEFEDIEYLFKEVAKNYEYKEDPNRIGGAEHTNTFNEDMLKERE